MEWVCEVLFERGRFRGNRHLVLAGTVRGRLTISEKRDETRNRQVRVAQMHAIKDGKQPPPPLHDVQLVALDHCLRLTGYERIQDGSLSEEHSYGQTWHLTPGDNEDLLHYWGEVNRLTLLCVQNGIDPRQQPKPEPHEHKGTGSKRRWGKAR